MPTGDFVPLPFGNLSIILSVQFTFIIQKMSESVAENIKQKFRAVKDGDKGKSQFIRFVLNGILASSIHYAIYYFCQQFMEVNLSYAIGYLVSFIVNFFTTSIFTFHTKPTFMRFIGFSGSHAVNFLLQVSLFWCCMQIEVHRLIAPVISMGVAMLVQFVILRFVFGKR